MPIVARFVTTPDQGTAQLTYVDTDNGDAIVSEWNYAHSTGRIISGPRAAVVVTAVNLTKIAQELLKWSRELFENFGRPTGTLDNRLVAEDRFRRSTGKLDLKFDVNGDRVIDLERDTVTGDVNVAARVAVDWNRVEFEEFQSRYMGYIRNLATL